MESSPKFTACALGHDLEFVRAKAVFSARELDEGSLLLLQCLQLASNARVCDLGCGWGAIGAFVARQWPACHVYSIDINARATGLARFNYAHNQLKNTSVWCGNGLDAVQEASFTDVLCNPPVRAGNAVIGALFQGAFQALEPGGSLWIVLRTAQGAKSWQRKLTELFGNCETLEIAHGFRILRSRRQES